MIRMFDSHKVRRQWELGGIWNMQQLSEKEEIIAQFSPVIPSCWESMRELEDFRGHCRYTRKINTKGGNIRLVFKGVSHTADVYFDGEHIAHHYNAYTQFDAVVSGVSAGEHTIEVVVDNRFSKESTLHFANDYKSYGGITRPVIMEELDEAYIRYLHITPVKTEKGWNAEIYIEISSISVCDSEFKATVTIGDKVIEFSEITFADGVFKKRAEISFDDVKEWCPENPSLYMATAKLLREDAVIDDLNERFGFREVRVEGNRILLNGKPLYIKGFNRHEDYGTLGCAIPENIMSSDLDIILSTGANLVRTSHYPNDERFIDLCDERGVLVWEEGHARQIFADRMQHPNYKKQALDCIDEMILNHYNHPSIILWGILNECESYSEIGRQAHIEQYERIKSLDKTRPTTAAANKYFKDICHDLPDVLSFNFYPKWYYNHDPKEFLERVKEYAAGQGAVNKPMLISEFGAAAIYGYRAFNNVKWSEDRQAEIISSLINTFYELDYLSGMIIWQFCDGRVDSEMAEFTTRPKMQNNKGVVDIYRRPKMSYYAVCDNYKKKGNYIEE